MSTCWKREKNLVTLGTHGAMTRGVKEWTHFNLFCGKKPSTQRIFVPTPTYNPHPPPPHPQPRLPVTPHTHTLTALNHIQSVAEPFISCLSSHYFRPAINPQSTCLPSVLSGRGAAPLRPASEQLTPVLLVGQPSGRYIVVCMRACMSGGCT